MRTPLYMVVVTVSVLGASGAQAAGKPANHQAQERAAKKACATGDFRKGIDILADLYVDTADPVWVFNQGRCYEQGMRYAQAIERFREYVRKAPDLSPDERADVEKHIADCEALMGKETATPQPAAPTQQPVQAPSAPVVPAPEHIATAPAPSADSGSGLRVAGIIAAGVGVAALATAIALNLKHESLVSQQNTSGGFSRSRESDVKTYETWSWVGYGVGAAALVAGGTLWLLGRRGTVDQATVSFAPIVDAHQTGCALQGAF